MSRLLRVIALLIVFSSCVYLNYAFAWMPYRVNILKKRVERQFAPIAAGALTNPPQVAAIRLARQNLEDLRAARRFAGHDVDLYLEIAAYERLMGDTSAAIDAYKRALECDQRPEIFRNLGDTEFATGHWTDAAGNYERAARFYPPAILWAPENLRPQIAARLTQPYSIER